MTAPLLSPLPPPPTSAYHHLRMSALHATPVHYPPALISSNSYDARTGNMSRALPITALLTSEPAAAEKVGENGRTYYRYRDEMYLFPADDTEHERLDIIHSLIYGTAMNDQVHVATFPDEPRRILDVGFGTGFWMFEMSSRYPNAEIIGLDLDNPLRKAQDRNCFFRSPIDFTGPNWGVEDASVDLVHMAQLLGCVPDWVELYRKAYRSLRPGTGQIEHIEFDWTPRSQEAHFPPQAVDLHNWWYWLKDASVMAGKPLAYREDTEELLERAGFADVSHRRVRVPLFNAGTKDKRERKLAHAYQMAMGYQDSQSFTGFSMATFTRYLRMSPEQANEICARALAVVQGQPVPLYITLHVWTARRPQS